MDKRTKKVLYSLEMLPGNATSSSLGFYRSKDRVTGTHHLVEKTGNFGWKITRAVICGMQFFSSFKPVKLMSGYTL